MSLSCPKCGAEVEPAAVDNTIQAARCTRCRRLVDLSAQLGGTRSVVTHGFGGLRSRSEAAADAPAAATSGARSPVPMPPRFKIEHGASTKISWRWFGPQFVFFVIFCVFWDGFLIVWYSVALGTFVSGPAAPALGMVLFPLIHVAVGVGLTYYTVCGFLNSTVIEVGSGRLTIKHGPLPWRGNADVDVASIEQLYSEMRVHRGKNGTTYSYDLMALERDGLTRKLVTGLEQPAYALFLEQMLESQLSITDRPVGGELPR